MCIGVARDSCLTCKRYCRAAACRAACRVPCKCTMHSHRPGSIYNRHWHDEVGLWHGLFCVCNCHLFMDYTVDTLLMMLLRIMVCVIKWINKQGNKGHHAKLYVAICLQIGWMDQTFWGWLCGLERVYNAFHVHCWACISQDCIIHPFDEFFVYVLFQLCLSSYLNNCSQFKVNFV